MLCVPVLVCVTTLAFMLRAAIGAAEAPAPNYALFFSASESNVILRHAIAARKQLDRAHDVH